MARYLHLVNRHGVYYWRTRLPRVLVPSFQKTHLALSLRTRDPRCAKRQARRLTSLFDEFIDRMERENRSPTTIEVDAITKALHDLILERCELHIAAFGNVSFPDPSPPDVDQDSPVAVLTPSEEAELRAREEADWEEYCAWLQDDVVQHPDLYQAQAETVDFGNLLELRNSWKHALATGDLYVITEHLDDVLRRRGIVLNPASLSYRKLAHASLKAGIQALSSVIAARSLVTNEVPPPYQSALPALTEKASSNPTLSTTVIVEQTRSTGMPRLADGIKRFCRLKSVSAWDQKAQRDATVAFRFMLDFFGDIETDLIRKSAARDFLLALSKIPSQHGKSPFVTIEKIETPAPRPMPGQRSRLKYIPLSMDDLADLADRIEDGLESGDSRFNEYESKPWVEDGAVARLSLKTQNKYLSYAHGLFDFLLEEADLTVRNPFEGLLHSKAVIEREQASGRCAWSRDELQALFNSPVWRGSRSETRRATPGNLVIKDAKFWVPLLGAFAGLRLEEACQLRIDDIINIEGLHCIAVRRGKEQILKNSDSVREIPIHKTLVDLGFLDHVNVAHSNGMEVLFPELERGGPYRLLDYSFSKWFTEYRRSVNIYEPWLDFHALRHSFVTNLKLAGRPSDQISALVGHARQGMTSRVYFKGFTAAEINDTLQSLDYGLNLAPPEQ